MKNHISVTQIKMFLRCPLQYKFRYIDGIKMPPAGAMVLGRSVHKGIEENYKQKKDSKIDLPLNKVLEIFSDSFDRAQKEEEINWEEDTPAQIKDTGIELLKVYQKDIAYKIQPVLVEEGFELEFENVAYTLKGYLDLIDQDKIIRETKTSKRSYALDAALTDIQLTAYNLAYKCITGEDPKSLCFDVAVKNKHPKIQTIEAPKRTDKELARFLKIMGYVSKAIETGLFYPNESYMCKVCGYRDRCLKW
jgi:putative RecB family exonuclease